MLGKWSLQVTTNIWDKCLFQLHFTSSEENLSNFSEQIFSI